MGWNYGQEGPIGTVTWKADGPYPNFVFQNDIKTFGVSSQAYTVPSNVAVSQDTNLYTTQMPQLTAQFGASNSDTFRAYAFNLESDTTSNGYGGIMNALIARVDMMTVGATWSKVEAIAGVINTKSSMTTGTVTDGYGTSGEILHAGGSTITTIRGLSGNVQITASGTIGTAYGTDSVITTTLGQTGTVTVKAVGTRSYVQINNTNAMQWAIGAENFVDLVAATTVTTDVYGSFNYIQNTTTATVSGNTYGSYDKVGISGAMVTTGVVYGTFSQLVVAGTAVGGTTNAALNAEIQWTSTVAPTQSLYAINSRWRVNSASPVTVAVGEGLHILAPNITAGNTITAGRGIRISNQGASTVTTAEGIRIDNQTGAGTNRAIITQGGDHVWIVTANQLNAWTMGDGTTTLYSVDSRTAAGTNVHAFVGPVKSIASASGNTFSLVSIPAYTYNTTGTATVTALNGMMLNVAQPTVTSAGASATTYASSVFMGGPPINAGSGSITNSTTLWVAGSIATVAAGSLSPAIAIGATANVPTLGIYWGSGAPTISAPAGSLYLCTNGSSGTTRAYINTTGSTTWTAINTVA